MVNRKYENLFCTNELIEGAQLSNSFIILLILDKTEESLTSSDISKTISYNSLGRIYKPASIHIKRSFRKSVKKRRTC